MLASNKPADPPFSDDPHELNVGPDGIALTEPHEEPAPPSSHLRLYVAALMLAPLVYFTACFFLLRSNVFLRHTQNAYLANMGYGLTLHNADCQVLIYGDSSAMIGIDPATVSAATHTTVCNIADFAGMMRLNGTMILDTYLANNPRPRTLLILLAPEDLAPTWRSDGNFESVMLRARYRPDLNFLGMALRHPEDVLSSIGISGRYAVTWLLKKPLPTNVRHSRELLHGRFPDPKPLLKQCMLQPARIVPPDPAWLANLRTRYGVNGTRVLIDVSPVPPCDPGLPAYRRELPPSNTLIDNHLETYPVNWYTTSGRLHLGAEGEMHLSQEIAAQVAAQIATPSAIQTGPQAVTRIPAQPAAHPLPAEEKP